MYTTPVTRFYLLFILLLPFGAIASDKIRVPAGSFNMGCSQGDSRCEKDEGPAGGIAVTVAAFAIDSHEVTVADYARCVQQGKCQRPKDHQLNKYCNFGAGQRAQHPVNCVDWQQAQDYCAWSGGRLPYEAEWEKAARAGSETAYPWGQSVSCKQAIVDDGKTMGSVPNEPDGCGEDRTWPVGSRQPNALGLYDMHGNAGEWTASWYGEDALKIFYSKGKIDQPVSGRQKIVRGGSWDENTKNLRSSYRNVKPPESGKSVYGSIGFRCVYDE